MSDQSSNNYFRQYGRSMLAAAEGGALVLSKGNAAVNAFAPASDASTSMCVCECAYAYVCVCVYVYVCMYVYIYIHIHTYTYMFSYATSAGQPHE